MAQKRYREANRAKRSEAARLSALRRRVRVGGERDKEAIDRKAREIMEATRRKKERDYGTVVAVAEIMVKREPDEFYGE